MNSNDPQYFTFSVTQIATYTHEVTVLASDLTKAVEELNMDLDMDPLTCHQNFLRDTQTSHQLKNPNGS